MSLEIIESKYPLVFGGFAGFFLTIFMGWNTGIDAVTLTANASVGCVIGAMVMKIFAFVLEMCIKSATIEKEKQRLKEESTPDDS